MKAALSQSLQYLTLPRCCHHQASIAPLLIIAISLLSVSPGVTSVPEPSHDNDGSPQYSGSSDHQQHQQEQSYSDSWVVEIGDDAGSRGEANELAARHGFINLGQVGGLSGVYHFALADRDNRQREGGGLKRRNQTVMEQSPNVTAELTSEETVRQATQQRVFKRDKREYFSFPLDPLWSEQWTLYNNGQVGSKYLDQKVLLAWLQGYTGKGVTVSIVDDGLLSSHPDLSRNFDLQGSYDFVSANYDPTPYYSSDSHGTNCAGVVAMERDNGYCGAGVAYDSQIGGLRVNLYQLTDVTEAESLSYNRDYIQIYSASWGPPDNGYLVEGPGYYTRKILKQGVKKGRNGLGSIWVWAAGNGGKSYDSCAADGYVSSMYTIAIGSATESGKQAYYDEDCSGKLAVTYSYNSYGYPNMVSTTTSNGCTRSFTGTSAAAPLVAGIIALVLEANPSLTWRDVQYLIVYTSDPYPFLSQSGWNTNGAGLLVSDHYGYGAIDAEALVTRAQHWTNVPEQKTCAIQPNTNYGYASYGSPLSLWFTADSCQVAFLEHVVVQMTIDIVVQNGYYYYYNDANSNSNVFNHKGTRRGDLYIELHSPSGTRSILLPQRKKDFVNTEGYYNWPFTSVLNWGENPMGFWEIRIYFTSSTGYAKVSGTTVELHGTQYTPESVSRIPKECSQECSNGCAAEGEEFCDSCRKLRMPGSLKCVSSCPKYARSNETTTESTDGVDDDIGMCVVGGYCVECSPRSRIPMTRMLMIVIGALCVTIVVGALAIGLFAWLRVVKARREYITI